MHNYAALAEKERIMIGMRTRCWCSTLGLFRPKYAACRCLLRPSAGSSPNPSRPRVGPACAPLARLRTTCWPFLPIAANCANAGGTPLFYDAQLDIKAMDALGRLR